MVDLYAVMELGGFIAVHGHMKPTTLRLEFLDAAD